MSRTAVGPAAAITSGTKVNTFLQNSIMAPGSEDTHLVTASVATSMQSNGVAKNGQGKAM